MASSSENNNIETLDALPAKESFQMYAHSIVAIFEYSKDEIIDWLKSFLSLMSLRDLVLTSCPKIFRFSVVSGLPFLRCEWSSVSPL